MTELISVHVKLTRQNLRRCLTELISETPRNLSQEEIETAFLMAMGEFAEFDQDRTFALKSDLDKLDALIDVEQTIVDYAEAIITALHDYIQAHQGRQPEEWSILHGLIITFIDYATGSTHPGETTDAEKLLHHHVTKRRRYATFYHQAMLIISNIKDLWEDYGEYDGEWAPLNAQLERLVDLAEKEKDHA